MRYIQTADPYLKTKNKEHFYPHWLGREPEIGASFKHDDEAYLHLDFYDLASKPKVKKWIEQHYPDLVKRRVRYRVTKRFGL